MNAVTSAIVGLIWTQFWQVTLVVLVVAVATRFACRQRPHLAYILWMVVLLKCLTPPLWSSPTGVFSWTLRGTATRTAEPVGMPLPQVAVHPVMDSGAQAAVPAETPEPLEMADLESNGRFLVAGYANWRSRFVCEQPIFVRDNRSGGSGRRLVDWRGRSMLAMSCGSW